MKKLIVKTALITLGVSVLLAVSLFGIVSLCAPAAMMSLCGSMGLTSLSGEYAYQEYERSGDLECLARSFLISAEEGEDQKADERFEALYRSEGFAAYCESVQPEGEIPAYSYRDYLCSTAAQVKYRLASKEEQKTAALRFAEGETAKGFPEGNPLLMLSVSAAVAKDKDFCGELLSALQGGGYDGNADFSSIVKILEETIHE